MRPIDACVPQKIKEYVAKTGQLVTKIPLKDNTNAYLMTNNQSCEVLILKGKEIVGGKGFRSNNIKKLSKYVGDTVSELQKKAKEGVSVMVEYVKTNYKAHLEESMPGMIEALKKTI